MNLAMHNNEYQNWGKENCRLSEWTAQITLKKFENFENEIKWNRKKKPVMVPWTTVPFLSSIDTVSLFNFIKNLLILKLKFKSKITT